MTLLTGRAARALTSFFARPFHAGRSELGSVMAPGNDGYPTSRTSVDGVATRRCSGRTPQQRCSTSTRDRRRGEAARVLEQTLGNRVRKEHVGREGHRDLSSEEEAHVAQLERVNPSGWHREPPKRLVSDRWSRCHHVDAVKAEGFAASVACEAAEVSTSASYVYNGPRDPGSEPQRAG